MRHAGYNICMGNSMKWLNNKRLIPVILIIAISITYMMGCYQGADENTAAKDDKPFYPERVVTVRITMADEDWEYLKTFT